MQRTYHNLLLHLPFPLNRLLQQPLRLYEIHQSLVELLLLYPFDCRSVQLDDFVNELGYINLWGIPWLVICGLKDCRFIVMVMLFGILNWWVFSWWFCVFESHCCCCLLICCWRFAAFFFYVRKGDAKVFIWKSKFKAFIYIFSNFLLYNFFCSKKRRWFTFTFKY